MNYEPIEYSTSFSCSTKCEGLWDDIQIWRWVTLLKIAYQYIAKVLPLLHDLIRVMQTSFI